MHACMDNVEMSHNGKPLRECKSPLCDEIFKPKRKDQVFHEGPCRKLYHTLARQAGERLIVKLGRFPTEEDWRLLTMMDVETKGLLIEMKKAEVEAEYHKEKAKEWRARRELALVQLQKRVDDEASGQGRLFEGESPKEDEKELSAIEVGPPVVFVARTSEDWTEEDPSDASRGTPVEKPETVSVGEKVTTNEEDWV